MTPWIQTIIVLLIVATAAAFVLRQAFSALAGRKSRIGSCCATGCPPGKTAAKTSPGSPGEKIAFIPIEMLARRR